MKKDKKDFLVRNERLLKILKKTIKNPKGSEDFGKHFGESDLAPFEKFFSVIFSLYCHAKDYSEEYKRKILNALRKSEKENSDLFRLEASKHGVTLWRNNSGAFKDAHNNFIRFGLANDSKALNENFKSSDLVGIMPDGRFIAVEAKAEGWVYKGTLRERAQHKFLNFVAARGGVAFFCSNINDFKERLKNENSKMGAQ